MVLFLLPMIVVVLLVTGTFSYAQTRRILREQKLEMIRNFIEKAETSVDNTLRCATEVTEMVLYYSPVYDTIFNSEKLEPNEQLEAYGGSVNYFNVLQRQFNFRRVRVFTQNENLMYWREGTYFFDFNRITEEMPVDIVLRDRTDQIKTVETYRSTPRLPEESARWQISVVRFVVDGAGMFVRAAVVVDIDAADLLAGWDLDIADPFELMLVNGEGNVLSSSYTENIGMKLPSELAQRLAAEGEIEDGGDFFAARPLSAAPWSLCARLPASYLYQDTESILTMTWMMIVLACALAALFTLFISKALTGRLHAFTRMLEWGVGQRTLPDMLDMHMEESRGDCEEIRVLLSAYNRMLSHIGELSRENAHMATRESRYRMEALRLQINAHFLYNTLASIKGYIEMNEAQAASRLLMKLASFFNHSLDRDGIYIPLGEEIEIVRVYLEIQQMVYAEQFDFTIDVDEAALAARVPKFILQPIIENALIHGMSESGAMGRIGLYGRLDKGKIRIRIEDSGPGFSPEMLDGDPHTKRGLGMRNVYKRLGLYFGGRAQMRIENRPQGGGCVVVELPEGGMSVEEVAAYDQDAIGGR